MNSRMISSITVFSSIYSTENFLPVFLLIGVLGSKIAATGGLYILYGLILERIYGPAAAFLGSVIGKVLTGGSLLFALPALVTSFVADCLRRERLLEIQEGRVGAGVPSATAIGWYSTEAYRSAPYYPITRINSREWR